MAVESQLSSGPLVRIDVFEGPLQLLLYLVERYEVDIHDVPISEIADQYFVYISLMERPDLEVAGEFLLMATRLLQMKLANLLPSGVGPEDGIAGDPGESFQSLPATPEELALRLEEYRRYRDLAGLLAERWEVWRRTFPTRFSAAGWTENESRVRLRGLDLAALAESMRRVEERRKAVRVHRILRTPFTVAQKVRSLLSLLRNAGGRATFSAIRRGRSRAELVATFLAMLELVRRRRIAIRQFSPMGDISIRLIGGHDRRSMISRGEVEE